MIVRVANAAKSTPREGSKRSTDLTSATDATCTRSSSGSPRCRNRRASWWASPRLEVISSSRASASRAGCSAPGGIGRRPGIVFPALRHSACPPRRFRSHARTEPSWLSRPCSSTSASRICSLSRALSASSGAASVGGRGPLQACTRPRGVAEHGQLQAEVPVPGVAALQRQEAQLAHGQPEILELLDVEAGAGRDGARHEPGQHDEVAPGREPQLDPVAGLEQIGRSVTTRRRLAGSRRW